MEPTVSLEFLLVVMLLIALSLGALYIYYDRKKSKTRDDPAYMDGLKFMAEGENRRAIEKFKETVRLDSDNIDAYIKIGVILRREGLFTNATRIHKDLTLRGNLTEEQLLEVNRNLALDYWYAEKYERAETYFSELKSNKAQTDWAVPYLLKIYEKRNDWRAAYSLFNQSILSKTDTGKQQLAVYRVRQGELSTTEGDEKSGRGMFKEAMKIDQNCASAYLNLGDSYLRENRTSDAINAWTALCTKSPENAYRAFERLEKALYEKGQFSKIEELYHKIIAEDEQHLHAIIALADIYRKKGEYDEAIKLLQQAQKRDLDANQINAEMVKVLVDKNQYQEAAELALELIDYKRAAQNPAPNEGGDPNIYGPFE